MNIKRGIRKDISDGILDRNRISKFTRSTKSSPNTEKVLTLLVRCSQGRTPTWGMVQEKRLRRDVSRGGQKNGSEREEVLVNEPWIE